MSYREELIQVAAVAVAALQDFDKGSTEDISIRGHTHFCDLIDELFFERDRQENKWGPQHHSPEKWMVILMEEVGEAANAILEQAFKNENM